MVDRMGNAGRDRSVLSPPRSLFSNSLTACPAPPMAGNRPAATSREQTRITTGTKRTRPISPIGDSPSGVAGHADTVLMSGLVRFPIFTAYREGLSKGSEGSFPNVEKLGRMDYSRSE